MLPFNVALRAGEPIVEQVVYAATRAIVSGQLRPGDRFPSVRTISQELRINPNTAQRIVAQLAERGLLEIEPGIGTIVATPRNSGRGPRAAFADRYVEPLIVEGRRIGLDLVDLLDVVREYWRRLDG